MLSPEEQERLSGPDANLATIAFSLGRRAALPALAAELVFGPLAGLFFWVFVKMLADPVHDWSRIALISMESRRRGLHAELLVAAPALGLGGALLVAGPLSALALARRVERPPLVAVVHHGLARAPVVATLLGLVALVFLVAVDALWADELGSFAGALFSLLFVALILALFYVPSLATSLVLGERAFNEVHGGSSGSLWALLVLGAALAVILVPGVPLSPVPGSIVEVLRILGVVLSGFGWLVVLAAAHHQVERPAVRRLPEPPG